MTSFAVPGGGAAGGLTVDPFARFAAAGCATGTGPVAVDSAIDTRAPIDSRSRAYVFAVGSSSFALTRNFPSPSARADRGPRGHSAVTSPRRGSAALRACRSSDRRRTRRTSACNPSSHIARRWRRSLPRTRSCPMRSQPPRVKTCTSARLVRSSRCRSRLVGFASGSHTTAPRRHGRHRSRMCPLSPAAPTRSGAERRDHHSSAGGTRLEASL